jgi:hypothetical protein
VNHFSWFGGIYDEPKNQFPNFGLDPDHVLAVWPDYKIDPRELARFKRIRNACLVGGATMRKFGWQVGQEITLRGTIFPVNLTLRIVGTIPEGAGNPLVLWFNREYLEEAMESQGGLRGVGMIWVRADAPEHVERIMHAVNELFRNSEAQVTAETEKSFFMGFFGSFRTFMRAHHGGRRAGGGRRRADRGQHERDGHPRAHPGDRGPEEPRLRAPADPPGAPRRVGDRRAGRRARGRRHRVGLFSALSRAGKTATASSSAPSGSSR